MKSILTKYDRYCMICGRPVEEMHHALYGSKHRLADEDALIMPLCSYHHNSSNVYEVKRKPVVNMSVHHCEEMKILSQQLAEVVWEREYLAKKLAKVNEEGLDIQSVDEWKEEARDQFRLRYGENYL